MTALDAALDAAATITGAVAVALVDHGTGRTVGSRGSSPGWNPGAGGRDGEVVRADIEAVECLGLRDAVEDILLTLDTRYHLIRPIRDGAEDVLFLHVALDRSRADPAAARRELRGIARCVRPEDVPGRAGPRGGRPPSAAGASRRRAARRPAWSAAERAAT